GCTLRRCDEGGGDEFPPPCHSARLKPERVCGASDRAVGNVFHARASQERHRPRLGARKCWRAVKVPAFEQTGGSPARGSSRGVSRIRPAGPVCSKLKESFDAMDALARRKSRTDRPAEERRVSRRRLSVVIPTWNRAHLVGEAVESALGQEGADLEVIVVDDGSTDGTAEIIERRFGKSVKLLRMATRSGVGAA